MAPEDLLPPAVAPAWRAMYERALSEGPFRTEYKTSYGNTLDVSFNPILEDGRKTGISVFTKEITAKKHTEAELKRLNQELEDRVRSRTAQLEAANSRLGAAQKAAMAGIWTWNISTGEMSWSPELFELFGLPATEQASFETWDRIVHPEDREGASANVQRAIKDRKPPENEYRIVMPEGQERWIRAVGNTVCDENSVAHSMSGICLDITDRKRAEKAVARLHQELERRATELQAIFQTVPIGLAMTDDPQGRHVHGNPAIEKMLGAAPGGELSKSVPECTPYRIVKDGREQAPDDLPMQRAARGETVSGDTFEIVRPDGCALTMYATAAPLLDEKHQPRGAVGAFLDITKQKCIEQELRDRTAQLQQSEQRVRRKLDSILLPEGDLSNLALADILDLSAIQSLLDDFHSVVHVTTALIDVQGKILAAVGWQSVCREFHRAHPDSCKFCVESDRELSTGIAEGEFRIYKCKNRMWDVATPIIVGGKHLGNLFCGQFFFEDEPVDYQVFRAQARMYGFEEEKYVAALDQVPRLTREQVNSTMTFLAKVARMISQLSYGSIKLARSTEQVNRANTDLQNTVKELEAFSYSVSHDLRAPLRHISGFSRILMEEFAASLPAEAQHHLQRIQEGTSRMGQLVDDLLNLGRVGRRELSLQVAGLRSIVDDVIASLKSEVGDRQVEWKIGDLPYVECDTSLIQQVFQNLLANALKFTRPRAQAVIEIGQGQRDGKAVIYVRDNGVGFSMKYADKLFGVFQRLHRAEDFEGTGVGLATVQRIIQKHAGRIWAEAELDKGATFYFTLGDSQTCEANSKIMIAGVNHA
jgi:PAS domain S-box-containing protein